MADALMDSGQLFEQTLIASYGRKLESAARLQKYGFVLSPNGTGDTMTLVTDFYSHKEEDGGSVSRQMDQLQVVASLPDFLRNHISMRFEVPYGSNESYGPLPLPAHPVAAYFNTLERTLTRALKEHFGSEGLNIRVQTPISADLAGLCTVPVTVFGDTVDAAYAKFTEALELLGYRLGSVDDLLEPDNQPMLPFES